MTQLKTCFLALAALAFATAASAQMQEKKTDTLKTPTIVCAKCKKIVEDYMMHEDGIIKINVDYRKKITIVTYRVDRTNIENIKTAIANVGFDAGDVTANPDSYKALPTYCKKTEDGGGCPPGQR